MTAGTTNIFWAALLALNPLICWGLFPASSCSASGNPRKAWPYALVGSLSVFLFSIPAWAAHPFFLQRPSLGWIELPLQLLVLFGLNRLMALALKPWPAAGAQLPLFHLNFLSLASGLLMLSQSLGGWPAALLTAAGMSLSFGLSLMLVSYIRERLESARFSRALSGWPLFLLLASVIWISCRGLMLLLQ